MQTFYIKFILFSKLFCGILAMVPRFQCDESRNFKNDGRLKVFQRSVFLRTHCYIAVQKDYMFSKFIIGILKMEVLET